MTLPTTVPYIGWSWDDLLFSALAGIMLGSALLVVLGRNIIRSGLWMILAFAALAGIYALLGAPLVAAAQVLIYIGAISVLILFAIMLTQTKQGSIRLVFHHQAWAGALAAIVLGIILIVVVLATAWPLAAAGPVLVATQQIASVMFSNYGFAIEVISVLLLAAVIGGVFLAKREDVAEGDLDVTNPPAEPPLPIAPPPQLGTGVGIAASSAPEDRPA
jgi:NADH:ubiquinone oxidoreductase subunit 6 (subunit J)